MPSITKPVAIHPSLHRNELGLTIRDYEGSMSTLCAGCGHDSITAAIIRACVGRAGESQPPVKMNNPLTSRSTAPIRASLVSVAVPVNGERMLINARP